MWDKPNEREKREILTNRERESECMRVSVCNITNGIQVYLYHAPFIHSFFSALWKKVSIRTLQKKNSLLCIILVFFVVFRYIVNIMVRTFKKNIEVIWHKMSHHLLLLHDKKKSFIESFFWPLYSLNSYQKMNDFLLSIFSANFIFRITSSNYL